MQSIDITGFRSGVHKDKKPFIIPEDAFINLENVYVWRDQLKKREGLKFIGRYRRTFDPASIGNTGASPWTINTIYSTYTPAITPESSAEIEPGSVIITFGGITFTDQGNGLLTSLTPGNIGYINYLTGVIVLTHTAGAGVAATASFAYFPTLPAMGITTREISNVNDENTLWFDTKYCYINVNGNFQEFIAGTTWNSTNSDFFWGTNYRGSDAAIRLFFETNFVNTALNPMRYTDGGTWTPFFPILSQSGGVATAIFLTSARILIPYYGRLLALNVWETDADAMGNPDYTSTRNIYNRCRFSQIGNPVAVDAWRTDQFGKGGFIDAPINEDIISATFYKNTLIVFFERSTWRLQYIGEYGIPFIWERISSDFGSESTFSPVLFDSGVLAVGDKAIVASSGGDVQRIDIDIPDEVYKFKNTENGTKRVHGIRNFEKEVVYWCYHNSDSQGSNQFYPNKTLLYNYRNNTWAYFRNNVTCYGTFQYQEDITWDRNDVFWDNMNVLWDSEEQTQMPVIVSGNQHGFAHFYANNDIESQSDSTISAMDQQSLSVTNVTVGSDVILEIFDHNLLEDEFIYLTGLNYVVTATPATGSTTLNDQIYMIQIVDKDNIRILAWDQVTEEPIEDFTVINVDTYVGGGVIALFPKLYAETKDFNPVKQAGQNIKTSFIDFLFDASIPAPINVQLKMNTTINAVGNVVVGNKNVETANSKTGYITDIQLSDPMDVSAPWIITSKNHGLLTGNEISPQDIVGTVELNGNNYTITFLTTDTFSINANELVFNPYVRGGYWAQSKQEYFTLSAQYAWHRFFATAFGQLLGLILTYNEQQMFQISTHRQNFVLNAIKIWFRSGGKNIFGK